MRERRALLGKAATLRHFPQEQRPLGNLPLDQDKDMALSWYSFAAVFPSSAVRKPTEYLLWLLWTYWEMKQRGSYLTKMRHGPELELLKGAQQQVGCPYTTRYKTIHLVFASRLSNLQTQIHVRT